MIQIKKKGKDGKITEGNEAMQRLKKYFKHLNTSWVWMMETKKKEMVA